MLEVKRVSKLYSEQAGIKDISFTLEKGNIVALIGPNGSGKTTLLNILAGVLESDSGEVFIDGEKNVDICVRRNIGYLPDKLIINPQTRVIDLLNVISDYKFNGDYKTQIERYIDLYCINDCINKKFGDLSMGLQKKVGIIIAFMGTPKLIILDEPTNGMDTHGILQLKNSILEAKGNGSTIIISSHILDFVNAITEQSYFLKNMELNTVVNNNENLENVYRKLYLESENVM
ncbi:ABC transporter ATP-binding protein [Butyrivibrio sp. YAB3001]|uniref:ABC transporter ATP-binding protein n=1 Tax=Butyrivibrio sp. YAB3001 TaxID=1520812 RepID=UPI0008F670C0|nr:ABC transporter ATP-binding protein [Butyrivibrio sp. YAB3001]SFB70767.1 ABC-2 type transport system ATP-binding protein [Butyrivibrio sp. YAB3001]